MSTPDFVSGEGTDAEWFATCGHCGHCGNPGEYCTCTPRDPCGCRHLHDMGSAKVVDALKAFEPVSEVTCADQLDMFGDVS